MSEKQQPETVCGAPGSIELGGRTYLVSQATPADLMAVRKRLKRFVKDPLDQYATLAADKRFRLLPRKIRDQLALEAGKLQGAGEKALSAEMADDMLGEAQHCRYLAWLLLRRYTPELRLEDLTPLVTEDNAVQVYALLARESGMTSLGE